MPSICLWAQHCTTENLSHDVRWSLDLREDGARRRDDGALARAQASLPAGSLESEGCAAAAAAESKTVFFRSNMLFLFLASFFFFARIGRMIHSRQIDFVCFKTLFWTSKAMKLHAIQFPQQDELSQKSKQSTPNVVERWLQHFARWPRSEKLIKAPRNELEMSALRPLAVQSQPGPPSPLQSSRGPFFFARHE